MSHAVAPGDDWYSPPAQSGHSLLPLSRAKEPALHLSGFVAPAAHAAPTGHGLQSSSDVAFAVPFHEPAGHSSAAAAPASQYEPGGQPRQPVARAEGMKLPAGQAKHAALASAVAKEPGQHSRHRPPAANVPGEQGTVCSTMTPVPPS